MHTLGVFGLLNGFFIFYALWGNSLINLVCKGLLILITYKIVIKAKEGTHHKDSPKKENESEIQAKADEEQEKAIKEIYVLMYVILNNAI
jgi:hypothetical protein